MSAAFLFLNILLIGAFFVLGLFGAAALRRRQSPSIETIAHQTAIDRLHEGVIVVDPKGRIVAHNIAAAALADLTLPATGRLLADVAQNRTLAASLGDMLLDGRSSTYVICHTLPLVDPASAHAPMPKALAPGNFQSRHIQVTRSSLPDQGDRRGGELFMLRDTTAQVQAEEALARQTANLTALHHVASSVGATLDPKMLLETIVTSTRDALGMSHATVGLIDPERGDLTITAESDNAGGASALGVTFAFRSSPFKDDWCTGVPITIENTQSDARLSVLHDLFTRRGTRSLMIVPLRAEDRLIGTLNLASAAPRRFNEAELALAQMIAGYVAAALANARLFAESLQAARAKSAILDTVSHEFRTPITAILGFTELYQENVLGPVSEEQHEALDAVHRNAHRLLKLVDDLLDLARLEAGSQEMTLYAVDVELCIQEVASALRAQFQKKHLTLKLDIAAALPFAWADAMWLRRVLMHLLNNALRFTADGTVTVRAFERREASEQSHLVIEVEDTGPGIPEAERETIFEPFRRVDDTRSAMPGGSGSGLGLAISKRAINQMDGRLTMRSHHGEGSVFTIALHPTELALEHA